ncbi:DNA-binding protein [Aromatoleum buckelii]|uniref:KfrA N-terminal DNA-binding domain-containing protein n=1 Tax=Aromatoleum buckelii TaxID=200254 RepID=A0ABX1MW43_9RHOO|nr:DNA-binding protein [Aromatoleum buckelii]MCK0512933.1 DNA-binding protein [Aromatoleum buckelii]
MLEIGKRGGVGQRDVWEAADALLLTGFRPTVERIRGQIGRGSPNTVGPHLDSWFKALGSRIQDPAAFCASPGAPDAVTQAARTFWEAALTAARQACTDELTQDREALAQEAASIEKERADLAGQRIRLADAAETQQTLIDTLKTQVEDARASLNATAAERVSLIASHERQIVQLHVERETLEGRLGAADEKLVALQNELSAVKSGCDRDIKEALLRFDQARSEARVAQNALAELRQHASAQETALASLTKQLAAAEAEQKIAIKAKVSLENAVAAEKAEALEVKSKVQTLETDLRQAEAVEATLQAALDAERSRAGELALLLGNSQGEIVQALRSLEQSNKDSPAGLDPRRRTTKRKRGIPMR